MSAGDGDAGAGPPRGTVLVTGASSGIGEACATRLAAHGWRVFAGVRRQEDGERLRARAGRIEPLLLDVTDADAVAGALGAVSRATGGRLGGVVNNAGVALGGPVEYLPLGDWRRQLEVNVIGQVAVARAAIALLRSGDGPRPGAGPAGAPVPGSPGRLVFMGSVGGRVSTPLMGPYNASKFALEAITESLRHELAPDGIRVSLIEPGAVRTPIWDKGRRTADELEGSLPAEAVSRYRTAIDGVRKGIDQQEKMGVAPDKVAAVVERALTHPRPRARYLVGRDAAVMAAMARFLPDRARDAVVGHFTRP